TEVFPKTRPRKAVHDRRRTGSGQLVPGQRPSDRQGVLHLRGHGPGRPAGGGQGPPARPPAPRRQAHLGLERPPSRWPPTWPGSTSASSTPAATGPTTGCGCTTPSTPDLFTEPSDPDDPASATFGGIAQGPS